MLSEQAVNPIISFVPLAIVIFIIWVVVRSGKKKKLSLMKGKNNMDEKERLRLKKRYEEMSDEELLNMLSEDPKEYQGGIYELLLEEAKKRGIEERISEIKRLKIETDLKSASHASTGKRFLNLFLDYLFIYGLSYAFWYIVGLSGLLSDSLRSFIADGGEYVVGLPFYFFYYFIFESIYSKSLAKFITRTKVLDISGSKPTRIQILKRSLSRLVPLEPLSGFGEKEWHGWHDRWSHTMVVDRDYLEVRQEIHLPENEVKTTLGMSLKDKSKRKTKKCPYCGERILYEAIKCQYCKEFLDKNKV